MEQPTHEATFTDEFIQGMLRKSRTYTIVILRKGANYDAAGSEQIRWEHVRRNFSLRAKGHLAIVCPVADGSNVTGVGIFTTTVEETCAIMDKDPGVAAGVFVYETHGSRSFPGDTLLA